MNSRRGGPSPDEPVVFEEVYVMSSSEAADRQIEEWGRLSRVLPLEDRDDGEVVQQWRELGGIETHERPDRHSPRATIRNPDTNDVLWVAYLVPEGTALLGVSVASGGGFYGGNVYGACYITSTISEEDLEAQVSQMQRNGEVLGRRLERVDVPPPTRPQSNRRPL